MKRLALALLLLACDKESETTPPEETAAAPPAPAKAAPADAARFDAATIESEAETLSERVGIPAERWAEIEERLEDLLAHAEFADALHRRGVVAVSAYILGEGGAIVKVTRGNGLVTFAGGDGARQFGLKATSWGAVVGGSKGWGVGLVVGPGSPEALPGEYEGDVATATAFEETTGVVRLDHRDGHSIYLVGAAAGLSANAGKSNLTLWFE